MFYTKNTNYYRFAFFQRRLNLYTTLFFSHQNILYIAPSGPVLLKKEPETSATGIRLSWKPISKRFWNREQIEFEIRILSANRTFIKSYITEKTSTIVSGLLPATSYIVDISGSTVFGGIQSHNVTVKTKESKFSCQITWISCNFISISALFGPVWPRKLQNSTLGMSSFPYYYCVMSNYLYYVWTCHSNGVLPLNNFLA